MSVKSQSTFNFEMEEELYCEKEYELKYIDAIEHIDN